MNLDGYSNEELIAIGSRKIKIDLPMSATDINSGVSFVQAQADIAQLSGNSEDELRAVGERKIAMPTMGTPDMINNPPLGADIVNALEDAFAPVKRFLGIRS